MPKRNNPFGDQSSLQLKTHIGEKEVDKGVCQQTRMQAVYERTQALLFNGMKQNTESDMAVDVNDNHTSLHFRTEYDSHKVENASLKQLHLNSNCELVQSEETENVEMETDFDMQTNKEKTSLEVPSSFLFGSPAPEQWTLSPLPTFGFNFGRSTGALSPAKSIASCSENHSPEKDKHVGQSCQNAFSLLMQSHGKCSGSNQKSHCRACHNCRQPIAVRDVIKCQFCEQYICSGCMRQCQSCFLHYCQLCSIVNYDLVAERAFCLACSGR